SLRARIVHAAAVALAMVLGGAMTAAAAQDRALAIFREAKATAQEAPSPAAERLLSEIARTEMHAGDTAEARSDFASLFKRVHGWGTFALDSPLQWRRSSERGIVEGTITYADAQA